MITQELQNYINQQRLVGVSDAQIRTNLMTQGWSQSDLDQVFGLQVASPMPIFSPVINSGKKHSWIKILGIVAIVIVLFVAVAFGFAWWLNSAPAKVAQEFMTDMSHDQTIAAYNLTSTGFQAATSEDQLAKFTTTYPKILQIQKISFTSRSRVNDSAEMQGTVTLSDGSSYPVVIQLKKEGTWKVYNMDIKFNTAISSNNSNSNSTSATCVDRPDQASLSLFMAAAGMNQPGVKWVATDKYPKEFPADFPKYSNAKVLAYVSMEGNGVDNKPVGGFVLQTCSPDNRDKVKKYFSSITLSKDGWQSEREFLEKTSPGSSAYISEGLDNQGFYTFSKGGVWDGGKDPKNGMIVFIGDDSTKGATYIGYMFGQSK